MKSCRGERIRATLLNRPSCQNRACGATGQQDLTYAMSALHLLSCFSFMQVGILAFLNLLSHSPHCLEKNPQEQPFLPAPSVPVFAPAALPSSRYLGGSTSWGLSPRPAAGLSCTYPAHWYCIICPTRLFNHPDDDSFP